MIEVWKPVSGFDGYEVSSFGRVRSIDRMIRRSDTGTLVRYKGKQLKPMEHRMGYLKVDLAGGVSRYIHRLVAIEFVEGMTEERCQVNHKDGNKQNNHFSNLEWVDGSENQTHAIKIGLKNVKFAADACRYEGPVHVFNMKGEFLYDLHGNREMKEKGFDFRLVSAVVCGKRKHHKQHIFTRG